MILPVMDSTCVSLDICSRYSLQSEQTVGIDYFRGDPVPLEVMEKLVKFLYEVWFLFVFMVKLLLKSIS
jgi:hypothetical protein